jgi:hypothetical protein
MTYYEFLDLYELDDTDENYDYYLEVSRNLEN